MNSRHQDLFNTLIELYTLHVRLGNLPANAVVIHQNATFNRAAALEAGYTAEAVRVMADMLYIAGDYGYFELFPSTYVQHYVDEPNMGVGFYGATREVDTIYDYDKYFPPHFLRITRQEKYGHVFLYDTEIAETFGPWIERFRKLKILFIAPRYHIAWDADSPVRRGRDSLVTLRAEENFRRARLQVRNLYLENGWDVDAADQAGFDVGKFVAQRAAHEEQVVKPLEDKTWDARRWVSRQRLRDELLEAHAKGYLNKTDLDEGIEGIHRAYGPLTIW
ncbi:hypothetical protein NLG97_g8035 [Lecanicillium saksenae]|uniref:Uncharacterized protein n=1 Tax=Lecanicillium saksenae TaxID=468837 RepID=A0ACC1QND3_9HYPO|nr:hypothetical protein NLG97_g8035 [Lecanicillium saksenae]